MTSKDWLQDLRPADLRSGFRSNNSLLDQSLRSADLRAAFRSANSFVDLERGCLRALAAERAALTPGLEMVRAMERAAEAVRPPGMHDLVQQATAFEHHSTVESGLTRAFTASAMNTRGLAELRALTAGIGMTSGLAKSLAEPRGLESASTMANAVRAFREHMPVSASAKLFTALGQPWRVTAIAIPVEDRPALAVTWPDSTGSRFRAAAFTGSRSDRKLSIEVRPVCILCRTPAEPRQVLFLDPASDEPVDVPVLLVCHECTQRAQDDPDYFRMILRDPQQYRLLDGNGEGDGKSTGNLRLVEWEDDDED